MKYLLSFCLFWVFTYALAQSEGFTVLKNKSDLLLVGKQIFFLEDKTGKMTLEDILKPENQNKFQKNTRDIFKPQTDNCYYYYWLKLSVDNQSKKRAWLELGNAMLFYVDYYEQINGKYELHTQTGAFRSPENKAFSSNVFWLPLSDSLGKETVYIRIYTEYPTPTPIYLATLETLSENKSLHDYVVGGFLGLVLIMFGYNTFLYFATKDPVYPWYLGYLCMVFVFMPFINNYPFVTDWFGESWHQALYIYNYTWSLPFFVCVGMFTSKFLEIKKNHVFIYRVLLFLIAVRIIVIPFFNISGAISTFALGTFYQLMLVVFYLFLLLTSAYLWLKYKNKNAYYHFLAWSGFSLGILVTILSAHNLIPYNYFSRTSAFFGTSWEILLFSLAFANRINIMKKEKNESQKALLEKTLEHEKTLAEQNIFLEEKVKEKTLELTKNTEELKTAYEDSQVINEELHQTQEELVAQRDALEDKNADLELQKYKIGKSIESAKLIQTAIFPTPQKLKTLFPEHFVLFMPKDVVSGDFYWVHEVGNKKILITADCTGHGVSGAFMTLIGSALLDRIVDVQHIYDPKIILDKLHAEIQDVLQQNQTDNTDGMDIVITVFEQLENLVYLTFAGAKRPLYYLSKDEKEVRKIAGSRKMIGGYDMQNKEFANEHLVLPKGTILYLCTDGYADQNNKDRKKFGENRMLALFSEHRNKLENQAEILKNEILNYMDEEEQRDDILIVGVKL